MIPSSSADTSTFKTVEANPQLPSGSLPGVYKGPTWSLSQEDRPRRSAIATQQGAIKEPKRANLLNIRVLVIGIDIRIVVNLHLRNHQNTFDIVSRELEILRIFRQVIGMVGNLAAGKLPITGPTFGKTEEKCWKKVLIR